MKQGFCVVVIATACFAGVAGSARADRYDDAFRRGNEDYHRGDYKAAIAAYREIDDRGIAAPDLFYNMGVTHHRLGEDGRAIWCFERALALRYDDEDARFNLERLRKLVARRAGDRLEGAERDPLWIRVVSALSPSAETWLFVVLYVATFVLLFLRMRAGREGRTAYTAGAALAGVGALFAGLLLIGRVALDRLPFGIVLPDAVAVREGADTHTRTAFEVHAGLRVRLLEDEDGWRRVRLANGLEGWVRSEDVGRL